MRPKKLIPLVLAAALVGGCAASKTKTQKQAATEQWNATRAGVLVGLAREQYQNGSFDSCRKTLDDALKLCPNNAQIHVMSAKLSIEQGQLDVADRELQTAKQLDPALAEAYYLSGIVYQRWQKPEVAYQNYHSARDTAPNELAYLLAEAEMLVAMDRSEEALALLIDRVVYFENSATIRDEVGQLYMARHEYGKAVEMLRQASILSADDLSIREHLALAYYFNKQYGEAIEVMSHLMSSKVYEKRSDLYVIMGESQFQIGRVADARASFETATELNGSSTEAWMCLAKVAIHNGDLRRAEIALRKTLALDPSGSETHLLLGYVKLRQDRPNDALVAFQQASSLDGSDSTSLCMIGYAFEKLGQKQKAIQYYAQALKLKPGDELATKLMAQIELRE